MLWNSLVDLLRTVVFATAHACNGSLGLAVCLVSLAIRLALLPLSVRLACRALAHQRRVLKLKPELDRLRKIHARDPNTLWQATTALHKRHGVEPVDAASLVGTLIQLPVLGAFYAALRRGIGTGVRFLWVSDLSRPSAGLTAVVTLLTVAGAALTPTVDPSRRMVWLQLLLSAGLTVWLLSATSALFALATGAGSLVGVLQALLVGRAIRRHGEV
jgi:YidC/Oxa1 family membrane protein insertase